MRGDQCRREKCFHSPAAVEYSRFVKKLPRLALLGSLLSLAACPKEEPPKREAPPPPPSIAASGAKACADPQPLAEAVSAGFFPASVGGFCVEREGEVKTFGEKSKLTTEDICTTAVDGECEVYKRYGLRRMVKFNYAGEKGATVNVTLTQYADDAGAYGMYTKRVLAGDPLEKTAPRVLAAKTDGALGTGSAYVWRGVHLLELQYNNDAVAPDIFKKLGDAALGALGPAIGEKLPGAAERPAAARALPSANLVPHGIEQVMTEPLGLTKMGRGAVGYYKEGDRRWRVVSLGPLDEAGAKEAMKTLAKIPGALPVKDAGDEGLHVVVQSDKTAPKIEALVARKGSVVVVVADDEYAIRAVPEAKQKDARLTKDEAVSKMKAILK